MIDIDALLEFEAKADTQGELFDNMRNSIRDLCLELKAAREIVSYHRASLCASGMAYLTCNCYGCVLLRKYDEVTRGDK